uniref:Non-structural protein 1 n=2 Tax=Rotavirus A TaxID=28875 RepID=A0A5J6BC63_9REOV|nr:NSP1 [Bovine rotavirus A]QDM35332.1 NSP1 [Rotavirus A]
MATFKDACYHYKKLNKLNSLVLKLGANDEWRPAPVTKYKGWCLDCCQYTNLTYCRGCALYHVCQWCSQYNRCFLDEEPHLLRMRTFKDVITKEDIEGLLTMYETLFPINEKLVNKFINFVKQRKCRNEYLLEWYNHLLMPITLQALTINLEDSVYYIFGYYDWNGACKPDPVYCFISIGTSSKEAQDDRNFHRMSHLPAILQQEYALRYFSKSRFLSKGKKRLNRNDFSDNLMEDRHSPTSLIQVVRNCISTHMNDYEWNKACKVIVDARNYINIMNSSYTEHYSVSQRCKLFTKYKFGIISKLVKPNYIFSNHESYALNVHNCKWCQINNHYKVWEDFRLRKIYNNIMDFIRALVKSNGNVGHCSSQESVYKCIPDIFLICKMEKWNEAVEILFNYLEPVDINGTEYALLDYEVNWEVRGLVMQNMDGKVPRILNINDTKKILSAIIFDWFDTRYMRETPMTTSTTNQLRTLNKKNELIDEYDLELSDVE